MRKGSNYDFAVARHKLIRDRDSLARQIEKLQGKLEGLNQAIDIMQEGSLSRRITLRERIIELLGDSESGLYVQEILEADGIASRQASARSTLSALKGLDLVRTTSEDKIQLTSKGKALRALHKERYGDK